MDKKSVRFRVMDGLYIAMMALPILVGIVIQILTKPLSEGISITGARIFFTVPMPLMDMPVTEAQVNTWLVMITIFGFCLFMTHGIGEDKRTKRQMAAEWIVEKVEGMVQTNMEQPIFSGYGPFICAIMALSVCSSLLTLFGLFPPTSDVNVTMGWAILVFVLITKNKLKAGVGNYVKGYFEPIFVMAPMNLIGEIATPISMGFRHYGNVISGTVIAAMVSAALTGLSNMLLGWLPGFLGEVPFLQIGIPAVLSLYFDIFSGCMQAFIFAMLTMLNISGAYPAEAIAERLARRNRKKNPVPST